MAKLKCNNCGKPTAISHVCQPFIHGAVTYSDNLQIIELKNTSSTSSKSIQVWFSKEELTLMLSAMALVTVGSVEDKVITDKLNKALNKHNSSIGKGK